MMLHYWSTWRVCQILRFGSEAENPTRKTIASITDVFGVSMAELVGDDSKAARSGKPGPPSKLQHLTQRLASLPKARQKIIVEMLEGILQKAAS